MRWLLLPLLVLGCGDDSDTQDTEERESPCNKTEADWEAAGTTAQAATICAASQSSCDCFVIGGTHFEEEHFCLMVAYDALAEDVAVTGDVGWTIESTDPEGTDCSAGSPCVCDLPAQTEVTVVATHPATDELEAQEVEISFNAAPAKLKNIDVYCP